jgi:putative nucleotidyltransferase with HDIG domain
MADPIANSHFRPLPSDVISLLSRVSASPRLIAHLILVHDVASRLVEQITQRFPNVPFDRDAVLYGAATHDLGKAIHFEELVQAGKAHEQRGFELLQEMGVSAERARFAFTHGNWETLENVGLEDLLVALADNCWKGKRPEQLESRTVDLLSSISGRPAWDCYSELDGILGALAADADNRLAWQGQFNTEQPGAR